MKVSDMNIKKFASIIMKEEFTSVGITDWAITGYFEDGFKYERTTEYVKAEGIVEIYGVTDSGYPEYDRAEVIVERFK